MNRLVVENITAGYGSIKVLHSVSVTLNEGELVTMLGTNGNGKSTLINCVMGLIRPQSGAIYLEREGHRIDIVGTAAEEIETSVFRWSRREAIVLLFHCPGNLVLVPFQNCKKEAQGKPSSAMRLSPS